MLFGMFLASLVWCAGLGLLGYFAWVRLGAHLKCNDEAVEALSRHLLVPLLGKKEPEEKQPE